MSRDRLAPYSSLSLDVAQGETPPPLGCYPEVVKTRGDAICTGPRSKEAEWYEKEKRRKGKQGIKQSSYVRNRMNTEVPQPISTAQGDLSADPAQGETPPPID